MLWLAVGFIKKECLFGVYLVFNWTKMHVKQSKLIKTKMVKNRITKPFINSY